MIVTQKFGWFLSLFGITYFIVPIFCITRPIDLTWSFENNTIYWTGVEPFHFTKKLALTTDKGFWLAMNEFCAGEHGGTHMDAPYHFNKYGAKIGELPLENFIVRGALVDISAEVEKTGPNATLQVKHLLNWQRKNGLFQPRTLLLIKFGWSSRYNSKESYLGPNYADNILSFPGISAEAAQWIANTKKFVGVGVDVASADPGFSDTFETHQILTANGLYILENVKLLENLPARNFLLVSLPMNIAEGTGAPLRLIAVPNHFI